MDVIHLTRPFERMGARAEILEHRNPRDVSVDIVRDREGQKFSITAGREVQACVPHIQPVDRHLLLVCKVPGTDSSHKFLCGHDEREWFAAAVPGTRGISSIRTAMEALKPGTVRLEMLRRRVPNREYASRHTAAYRRQGEWFFIPRETLRVDSKFVNRNEMLLRGRGKPHFAEFGYRTSGQNAYSTQAYRNGEWISEARYLRVISEKPSLKRASWRTGRVNVELFVKGRVRHPDHATINLDCWHLVRMNTESDAPARRHLLFID